MQYGDIEPANLFSENVLRKTKQEYRDKELGVESTDNPMLSVLFLKYNQEFAGSIHEIGYDKMYVMYWLPEQMHLYKEACKKRKINNISIDATGSLVRPIMKPDGSKNTKFFCIKQLHRTTIKYCLFAK